MPNDLLRYLFGPAGFSWWWWVPVALLVAAVAGWYVAVMVWTPFEEIFKLENVAVPPEAVTVVVPVMPGEATEMLSVW